MQRLLLTIVFLVVSILSTFAQKLDFTAYLSYSSENIDYTKFNRHVMFSGKPYRLTITDESKGEVFKLEEEDSTIVFEVAVNDCVLLKQTLKDCN